MALPQGWVVAPLGEICTLVTDGTHKTPKYVQTGVRFISIANIKPFKPIDWDSYVRFVTSEEHEQLCKRVKPQYNDILYPRVGTLGYAKRIDFRQEVSIFVGLGLARPIEYIVFPQYLEYFMNTMEVELFSKKNANGTGRMTLPLEMSRVMPVKLPPLAEQHRIVAKIDALFSELDKGVEMLQTVRAQLRTYRQAVLKWAFEGLDTIELGEISEAIDPQPSHRTPPEIEGGIPYVGIRECNYDTKTISFATARKVSPEVLSEHLARYTLHNGDIIIGKIGTIGKPFLIPSEQTYTLSANVVLLQPNFDKTAINYIFYAFQTLGVDLQLRKANSTTQAAFGIQRVRMLKVPYIDNKNQQKKVVAEIESRLSVCDKLEQLVDETLAKAQALRQSILKKAFAGELVPQDPHDEPAEKLLERIKAMKAAATKTTTARRTRK